MLRFYLALFLGKISKFILSALHKNGTHFPGTLALKICPAFLDRIAKPDNIICITGTNGKTTTSNLLESSLRNLGYKFCDNSFGSNTYTGIASTCINSVSLFNKLKVDTLVLEVDERSSLRIYPYLKPTWLICTNLFRDSLMRNAHTEFMFDMIDKYIPDSTKLILNADDIISSRLGLGRNADRHFFGIAEQPGEVPENNIVNDARICPDCGAKLVFDFRRYHHIGKAHCPVCGLSCADPDYEVTEFDDKQISIKHDDAVYKINAASPAVFNVYNEVAVFAFLCEYGVPADKVVSAMNGLVIDKTRHEEESVCGVRIIRNMLKGMNPIAASRNCRYALEYPGQKTVILMMDDVHLAAESSENIAWHYESDFEALNDPSISHIYIGGIRCEDVKYRLLLGGIPEEKLSEDQSVEELFKTMKINKDEAIIILYDMYNIDELHTDLLPILRERIKEEANVR